MNAIKNGLQGIGLLLPGERMTDYQRHLAGVLDALRPQSEPEAQAVAVLADLQWRRARWFRVEREAQGEEVERKLKETQVMKDFSISTRALTAVNALVDAARGARPTDARAVSGFVSAARQVTLMVGEVEGRPERALRNLLRTVDALDSEDRAELWAQRFEEVAVAGQSLAEQLANRVNAQRKRLDDLRKTLSKTALPSDGDLKKLARYEAMLARATEAQLRVIGEMREQVKKARTGRIARKASSFGSGSSPPFKLRVVR